MTSSYLAANDLQLIWKLECGDLGLIEGVKDYDNLLESLPIVYSKTLHVNYLKKISISCN